MNNLEVICEPLKSANWSPFQVQLEIILSDVLLNRQTRRLPRAANFRDGKNLGTSFIFSLGHTNCDSTKIKVQLIELIN